jgi:iron complex transport system substrate-binding protein
VTDDSGATVAFEEPPSAIVSLSAAHVEVLYAIGAGDQLVAGDLFSTVRRRRRNWCSSTRSPSVEAITALEPDLVILASRIPISRPRLLEWA